MSFFGFSFALFQYYFKLNHGGNPSSLVQLPWPSIHGELTVENVLVANVRSSKETVEFLVVIVAVLRRPRPNWQPQKGSHQETADISNYWQCGLEYRSSTRPNIWKDESQSLLSDLKGEYSQTQFCLVFTTPFEKNDLVRAAFAKSFQERKRQWNKLCFCF